MHLHSVSSHYKYYFCVYTCVTGRRRFACPACVEVRKQLYGVSSFVLSHSGYIVCWQTPFSVEAPHQLQSVYIFKNSLYFICISPACVYLRAPYACSVPMEVRRGHWIPLGLELKMLVNHHEGAEN